MCRNDMLNGTGLIIRLMKNFMDALIALGLLMKLKKVRKKKQTMMLENCIHYDACKDIYYPMSTYDEEAKSFDESNSCYECQFYSDKSRFIELPCNVGDTVYICINKIKECKVVFIGLSEDNKFNHINFVENYADGKYMKTHSLNFDCIGKYVFTTYEDAEKALKEKKE